MQITVEIDDKYIGVLTQQISVQRTLANAGGVIDDYVDNRERHSAHDNVLTPMRETRRNLTTLAPVLDALFRAAQEAL